MDHAPLCPEDHVDRIRADWVRTYPTLDTGPLDVIGRIRHIGAVAFPHLDAELTLSGVTRPEFDILCALARTRHPLRAGDLACETGLSGASVTHHVEQLVALGHVARFRHERDGRVVLLELTDSGRELVESELPRHVARERRTLDGFTDDELTTLIALLRRVAHNAGAHAHP